MIDSSIPRLSVRNIRRWEGDLYRDCEDDIIVEEPLELRACGRSLAVLMRTPGDDLELVRGLLHTEGVVRSGDRPVTVIVESGNVISLEIDESLLKQRWSQRDAITSSACGVCGAAALAVLEDIAGPVMSDMVWGPDSISGVPQQLRDKQELFQRCGGVHGAALFSQSGQLVACREDIGRHNAVDKIIGWALVANELPASELVLGVSSRLSYEIVHKAITAGIPIVVGISAPSSLAIDLAERWRVTLIGFVRGAGFNVYSHGWRIVA